MTNEALKIKRKGLKYILLLLLPLIFISALYFWYIAQLKSYVTAYNDAQWKSYLSSWNVAREHATRLVTCRNIFIQKQTGIAPNYIKAKEKELAGLDRSGEDAYYISMYHTLDSIINSEPLSVTYYAQETPNIEGGLFLIVNKYDFFTWKYINSRKPKNMETLAFYKNQFEQENVYRFDNTYCPDVSNLNFDYPLKKDACKELTTFFIKNGNLPKRGDYNLEVEYLLANKRYEDGANSALAACDNPNIEAYPFRSASLPLRSNITFDYLPY